MFTLDSNKHWKEWGKQNPYYGVYTFDEFKGQPGPQALVRFFESGESHISRLLDTINKLHQMDWENSDCVDFGCGVGRLLLPLATRSRSAVGIDISDDMLRIASKHAAENDRSNVTLLTNEQWICGETVPCDFLHSFIVFQHMPSAEGLKTTEKLLAGLRPGGIAALHFTVKRRLRGIKKLVYLMKHHMPGSLVLLNILQGRKWNVPSMQMNEYDAEHILEIFFRNGLSQVTLHPEVHKTALGFYFIARRACD